MKVEITDLYYIKGADDLERVKVSYLILFNGVRIVGQVFMNPYPIETLEARVEPVVNDDLSTKADVIQAVRAAAAKYVDQEIDVSTLFEVEE